MEESRSCPARRTRIIQSGGTGYSQLLRCEESEVHQEHYDYTFSQAWRDDEFEPENTSSRPVRTSMWSH
jgi:hypothetical protein